MIIFCDVWNIFSHFLETTGTVRILDSCRRSSYQQRFVGIRKISLQFGYRQEHRPGISISRPAAAFDEISLQRFDCSHLFIKLWTQWSTLEYICLWYRQAVAFAIDRHRLRPPHHVPIGSTQWERQLFLDRQLPGWLRVQHPRHRRRREGPRHPLHDEPAQQRSGTRRKWFLL